MPIELQQFTNIVHNPRVPDSTVLGIKEKENGHYEVTHSATNFLGRAASWIRKARTSAQHAAGQEERSQAVPATQMELLRSIAGVHGTGVAFGVMKQYDLSNNDSGPLTKYRVRQVLNYVNRFRTRSDLDKLPTELTLKIFTELPLADLLKMQGTEKSFLAASQKIINERHADELAGAMLLGFQKKAVALAEQRTRFDSLRKNQGADQRQRNAEAMFQSRVKDWLARNRPEHVSIPLNSLRPNLRPIALQLLMNCNHLKRLDLDLALEPGQRYKQTFDDLDATLPMACVNNPELQVGITVTTRGSLLAPGRLHADEMATLTGLPLTSLKLTRIGLDDNMTAMLGNLHDLRHLTIVQDAVTEQGMETIAGLPNLETFALRAPEPGMSVEQMQIIGGMHRLQELGLSVAGLNAEHLAALADAIAAGTEPSSLTKLDINGNIGVTDEAVPHLIRLHPMESVNLGNCRVGDQGALALASAAHMGKIDLKGNRIGGDVKARITEENPNITV
jgi:hypothetical protein